MQIESFISSEHGGKCSSSSGNNRWCIGKAIAVICHLWHTICMKFQRLIEIVGDEPVFEAGLLLSGEVDPADLRRQLSRWTKAGWLFQLRRGLYSLAPPFQKVKPHPFLIANRMVRSSYVSCQSALAYYGIIPEHVPVITSVTTMRPGLWKTPLGIYQFRHIKSGHFAGYRLLELGDGQRAFVATPEKALLDLVYLQPGGDSPEYLKQLRLQQLSRMDIAQLRSHSDLFRNLKLSRAATVVAEMAVADEGEYETL